MSLFVGLVEFIQKIRGLVEKPIYKGPESREDKVCLIDTNNVLKAIPRGIPAIQVVGVDISRETNEKKDKFTDWYRWSIAQEYRFSPLDYCTGYFWLETNPLQFLHQGLDNQLIFLLQGYDKEKKGYPTTFCLKLEYSSSVKPDCLPLDCEVHFKVIEKTIEKKESKLKKELELNIAKIVLPKDPPRHRIHLRGEGPGFVDSVNRAMTSFLTTATIREHFLYTHVLTVQTIYSISARFLSKFHPIYMLVHPHGYEVNTVNLSKGNLLINESFIKDFSFSAPNLSTQIETWIQEFNISHMTAPFRLARAGFTPTTAHYSPALHLGLKLWHILLDYVSSFLHAAYSTDTSSSISSLDICLHQDKELVTWYSQLSALRYRAVPGTLCWTNLTQLLTTYLWTSIFYHEWFGDASYRVAEHTHLRCPKTPSDPSSLIVSQQFFRIIFNTVIQPQYLLHDPRWPLHFPEPFRSLATHMQSQVQSLTSQQFEIGVNK